MRRARKGQGDKVKEMRHGREGVAGERIDRGEGKKAGGRVRGSFCRERGRKWTGVRVREREGGMEGWEREGSGIPISLPGSGCVHHTL